MENNTFFGIVLRSLGYTLFNAGGRVSDATDGRSGGGYMGFGHMVNIVTIEGQRYLVDVGFGAPCAPHPMPLIPDYICRGIPPQSLRLEYKQLKQHTDASQRAWVYSHRESDDADWFEDYSFLEVEFLPGDYEVMNLSTMTRPQSFFTQVVVCVRIMLDEEAKDIEGRVILLNNEVRTRTRSSKGQLTVVEKLENEAQRVKALEKWFGIALSEDEKKGVIGLATELKVKG